MVPLAQVAGSWTLTSVSGVSLPATIQAANPRLEIISETLVIRTDGTFEQTRLLRSTNGGQASDTLARDKGTYDLYVAAAMLHFQGNGTTASAEIDGSNLIVSSPGNALTYRKQ